MTIEKELIKKMNKNKKYNSWWLKILKKPILIILKKHKVPSQTIGVFFNPLTSNQERIRIVKYFIFKNPKGLIP